MTATDQPAFGANVEDFLAPKAPDRPTANNAYVLTRPSRCYYSLNPTNNPR